MTKEGVCAICNRTRPLTFEHLPPQSAFNKEKMHIETFDEAMQHHPLDPPTEGIIKQGGVGVFSLCKECNSNTGAWYVNEYKSWAEQADRLLKVNDSPKEPHVFKGYPCRFFKQIVAIFMSVDRGLIQRHPHLYYYLWLKGETRFPRGMKVYAFYNPARKGRMNNNMAILDIETRVTSSFVEFVFYPFGFLLTEKSPPPDARLVEITHLAGYKYDEYAEVPLLLPSFPVIAHFGGIYHPMDEVRHIRKPTVDENGMIVEGTDEDDDE